MSDLIDRTATQVRRPARRRGTAVHRLLAATQPDGMGRQYKTECHRYLYADEGAMLTTRPVSCAECKDITTPPKATL